MTRFLIPYIAAWIACLGLGLLLPEQALSVLDDLLTDAVVPTGLFLVLCVVSVDTTILRMVRTLRMSEVGVKSRAQRHLGGRDA